MDDFKKISKAAAKGAWDNIVGYIIVIFIMLILGIALSGCIS